MEITLANVKSDFLELAKKYYHLTESIRITVKHRDQDGTAFKDDESVEVTLVAGRIAEFTGHDIWVTNACLTLFLPYGECKGWN